MWPWVFVALLAVALTLGLLLILVNLKKRGAVKAEQPNHRMFFFIGTVMLVVGTIEMLAFLQSDVSIVVALPLVAIGLVFFVIGLANRDKWNKM